MSSSTSFFIRTSLVALCVGCSGTAAGTGLGTRTDSPSSAPSDGTAADQGNSSTPSQSGSDAPTNLEALFGPPIVTTITENVVTGLWAGSAGYADIRLRIGTSSVVVAVKCSSEGAVGGDLAANVSIDNIRILSSRDVRANPRCYFDLRPRVIPRCKGEVYDGCFTITGTTLRFQGVKLFSVGGYDHEDAFSKISD